MDLRMDDGNIIDYKTAKSHSKIESSKFTWHMLGLCLFMWCLSFKPSEPYLSQFLICNYSTQDDFCSSLNNEDCLSNPCNYQHGSCSVTPCNNLTLSQCNDNDYDYCTVTSNSCSDVYCYKYFSEDEVNNDIYPWSTYAYFPFLLFLGPYAEIFSYQTAILVGISGRVVTRFLLIFGSTLAEMQIMQVTYAMGTAAEDIFSAYIYYAVPVTLYTQTTSYVKTVYFLSCVLSGILGDILVTQFSCSIDILMIISAISVSVGAVVGIFVIRPVNSTFTTSSSSLRDRMRKVKMQLVYLAHIWHSNDIFALVIYWIFGNAVFMITYSYEVSIYDELNGSNAWNGSVLSIMLFGSSIGSMIPSYLDTGSATWQTRNIYLVISEIICVISSFSAICAWQIEATVALLTIFFTAWQVVNVVTYAQLAHCLKDVQIQQNLSDQTMKFSANPMVADMNSSAHPLQPMDSDNQDLSKMNDSPDPPYSIAIVIIAAICVLIQIIFQSILFSGLQYNLKAAFLYLNYAFIGFTSLHVMFCIYRIKTYNGPKSNTGS